MATLSIPNSFSPNVVIQSSLVNANWSAVATWANTYAVQTDVAKTVTVTHTWSADQNFGGRIVLTSAVGKIIPGATSISHRNAADSADNLLITDAGAVTVRAGLTITAGGLSVTGNTAVTGTLSTTGNITALGPGPLYSIISTGQGAERAFRIQTNALDRWYLAASNGAETGSNVGSDFYINRYADAGGFLGQPLAISRATGVVTIASGLVVSAGGVTATGNSTITGNLVVSGTVTAVGGSNTYVRRTTDLTFTTGTDSTLTFAMGASDEWEAEYVLYHTNGSAATMTATLTGPAGVTPMLFGGFDGVNVNVSAVVGGAQTTSGNAIVGFTMNATMAMAIIRLYVKGGGTGGNVTLQLAASAGTGTLKAGSFIRYSRIA